MLLLYRIVGLICKIAPYSQFLLLSPLLLLPPILFLLPFLLLFQIMLLPPLVLLSPLFFLFDLQLVSSSMLLPLMLLLSSCRPSFYLVSPGRLLCTSSPSGLLRLTVALWGMKQRATQGCHHAGLSRGALSSQPLLFGSFLGL